MQPLLPTTEPNDHWDQEHPHDREAYAVFASAMGWAVDWWNLGTEADIPGPGRLPFILAFRRVRELAEGGTLVPGSTVKVNRPAVDHWAEWLKAREAKRAERKPARKLKRSKSRA